MVGIKKSSDSLYGYGPWVKTHAKEEPKCLCGFRPTSSGVPVIDGANLVNFVGTTGQHRLRSHTASLDLCLQCH